MAKDADHPSCKDDSCGICNVKSAEGGDDGSSQGDQSQPAPPCSTDCPCKLK